MIVVQVHHAIGILPGSPLSDYRWQTLVLGGQQETFANEHDPAIPVLAQRLLTRPDVIGVRLVFEPDATGGSTVGVHNSGDIVQTFGQ